MKAKTKQKITLRLLRESFSGDVILDEGMRQFDGAVLLKGHLERNNELLAVFKIGALGGLKVADGFVACKWTRSTEESLKKVRQL